VRDRPPHPDRGAETYAYLTVDELLTAFATNSVEADCRNQIVLMPIQGGDILRKNRNYYNRFLAKRLANPVNDAKQLVLFQNIPLSDTGTLRQALEAVQGFCGTPSLAACTRRSTPGDNRGRECHRG
jgi:hypothetical protein